MTHIKQLLILVILAGSTFFASNTFLNGSLTNPFHLSGELKSPKDSTYLWKIGNEPPFQYRILHRAAITPIYKLVSGEQDNNQTFFLTYKIGALFFHLLAVLIFYFFLVQINLSEMALSGAILFALLPPLAAAYNLPVHTREDTMAYSLLILGLLAIMKNKVPLIFLFAILGVLCRETLLLIPFVNLFFNKRQNLFLRLFISSIAFGTFLLVRWHFGLPSYDYWEGLRWNVANVDQVIGFSFITFGFLWLPFFLSFLRTKEVTRTIPIITPSGPSVFVLVVATTFLGGIFNEIRLLYLLSPWVIVATLSYYLKNEKEIKLRFFSKRYLAFASIALLVAIVLGGFALSNATRLVGTSQYDIPFALWIVLTILQVYLSSITVPLLFKISQSTISSKN